MLLAALVGACSGDAFNFTDKRLNPEASGPWVKQGADRQTVKRDLEACWTVARAQVARDRRIDDDIAATQGDAGGSQAARDLEQAMTRYGYERRRKQIVVECMKEKGYTRR